MIQVNIHHAKTHLSRLIQKVVEGEEVVISKGNKPIVKLMQILQYLIILENVKKLEGYQISQGQLDY